MKKINLAFVSENTVEINIRKRIELVTKNTSELRYKFKNIVVKENSKILKQ